MLWATMRSEYHMSDEEFLDAEPSRINALNAAACERAGMDELNSYRVRDFTNNEIERYNRTHGTTE